MNLNNTNGVNNIKPILIISLITILITVISVLNVKISVLVIILGLVSFLVGILFIKSKFNIYKTINILFFLCIPYMVDLGKSSISDYHLAAKTYYRPNIMHIFTLIFLILILKNIKKIKRGIDLWIIVAINIVMIISIFIAINTKAAFYDYFRYLNVSIIYIYISRVVYIRGYYNIFTNCLVFNIFVQFIIGIGQKIKGGALGLKILGEPANVFRVFVSGYEKGMSGTFPHPGPLALFGTFVLAIVIFNSTMNKYIRINGIILSIGVVILAAGRTGILLMLLVLAIYLVSDLRNINSNKVTLIAICCILAVIGVVIFNGPITKIIDRFVNSDISHQMNTRLDHFMIAGKYIERKPILGLGLNNYLDYTHMEYPISVYQDFNLSNPIHNAFLLIAVEIGILGLICFISFLITTIINYKQIKKYSKTNKYKRYRGIIIFIFVYCIYSLQGWAGLQTRSIIMVFVIIAMLSSESLTSINEYKNKKW